MRTPPRSRTALAVIALTLVLATGSCSGENEKQSAPGAGSTPSGATTPSVPMRVTIGKVAGRLPKDGREHLTTVAGEVVEAWFEAAYLGGDYPRNDFRDAFPGFTPDARSEARHDLVLMSNAGIGSRVDTVEATTKRVRVDVLAAHRRPVGATARFVLGFRTTGAARRRLEVRGRLLLTRTPAGWRVFGYDVTKGDVR